MRACVEPRSATSGGMRLTPAQSARSRPDATPEVRSVDRPLQAYGDGPRAEAHGAEAKPDARTRDDRRGRVDGDGVAHDRDPGSRDHHGPGPGRGARHPGRRAAHGLRQRAGASRSSPCHRSRSEVRCHPDPGSGSAGSRRGSPRHHLPRPCVANAAVPRSHPSREPRCHRTCGRCRGWASGRTARMPTCSSPWARSGVAVLLQCATHNGLSPKVRSLPVTWPHMWADV